MCGINGVIRFDGKDITERTINLMNKKIVHRGPDDQGVFIKDNVGLGHVRLAIVDLSKKGHQPMIYEHQGKRVIMTYNGEVYNFPELRKELEGKGYNFNSNTDTEVLLASYLEDSFDCIKKWNGMFAFVIYDPQKQILFGARDRFGQKPLKYFLDNKQFIFSSELKAILENSIKRELDLEAIDDYLTRQYVPNPKTGFKNIFKLPHAHYFTLNIKTGHFEIKRYFDLNYANKQKRSKKEWMSLIEKQLDSAVQKRLIADVPLGAFLSGGIDSSAIVAFMSKHTDKIKTFSISFDEKDFDETKYARLVAERYKTDHTEFKVRSDDLSQYIEELVYQFEEPFADPSNLPTFLLSKLTKEHVTVALSGDAGDENFGGYNQYRSHLIALRFKPIFYVLRIIRPFLPQGRLRVLLDNIGKNIARRHYNFTTYFDEGLKSEFYREEMMQKRGKENAFEKIIEKKSFKALDKVFYLDFNSYLPDDINVKVDLASMLSALEVRAPLLDYELVSLATQMPWEFKVDMRQGKKIFKKMLEKYLPKRLLYRKKQGFGVPLKHWFRKDLKKYLEEKVMDEKGLTSKLFKKEKIQNLIKEHEQGKDHAKKLWALLVLNIWYQQYFNQ